MKYLFKTKLSKAAAIAGFCALSSLNATAQTAPNIMWDKTLGGSDGDDLRSLQQTADGGYILGGFSESDISGDKTEVNRGSKDFWVLKLDANGIKVWDKTIGGSGSDELASLQQTADGGYILGGASNSPISGDKTQPSRGFEDYWVVKLDASGIKVWDKTIGGSLSDGLFRLQQTTDGGYILGGYSYSPIAGDKTQDNKGFGYSDYWVVKLNSSGTILWEKTIGGSLSDGLYSLQQTTDGGYILGGHSNSPISGDKTQASKGGSDYWVIKLDSSGAILWEKTIGGSDIDRLTSLQQTADGGYILGGQSDSPISGDKTQASKGSFGASDYWVIKLNSSGTIVWNKTIGGSATDWLTSLQQTSDGGYILGGYSNSPIFEDKTQGNTGGSGDFDQWVVKLNSTGTIMWDKTIGGNDYDGHPCLQQTSDGGYILGGASSSPISGNKTQASKGSYDYWVVKLGPEILSTGTALSNLGTDALSPLMLPNPAQAGQPVALRLNTPLKSQAFVYIYDALGRQILQQVLEAGQTEHLLELQDVKAGLYQVHLLTDNLKLTGKVVVTNQ